MNGDDYMKYLWSISNKAAEKTKRNPVSIFIILNTAVWSLLALMLCISLSFSTVSVGILLASIVLSLFGGVIYMLRQN